MKKTLLSLLGLLMLSATGFAQSPEFQSPLHRPEPPTSLVPKPSKSRLLWNSFRRRATFGNQHKVHFVYLVPSDKQEVATTGITNAVLSLQRWYQEQMGNGKTFTTNNPIVQVFHTDHDSSWYSTHPLEGDSAPWFYINTIIDCNRYAGSDWYQEFDDWVIYVDATPAANQYAGGTNAPGAFTGFAVLWAKDVAAVQGIDPDWTYPREVGGLGHEYGHTHGLPHPPPGPEFGRAIMGTGFTIYPNCILVQANKDQLNGNPFFAVAPTIRPAPVARPRPTPYPRPGRNINPTPPPK